MQPPDAMPMKPLEDGMTTAYGNLCAALLAPPLRSAFMAVAIRNGMTLRQFEAWAAPLQWR